MNKVSIEDIMSHSWSSIKNNPVAFFITPAICIILGTFSVFIVSFLAALGAGTLASDQGNGLLSGNPVPFIFVTLIIVIVSALMMTFLHYVLYNTSYKTLYGKSIGLSEVFSCGTSSGRAFGKILLVNALGLLIVVPLVFFTFGMYLMGKDGLMVLCAILSYVVSVVVGVFITFALAFVVRIENTTGGTSLGIKDTWNFLKSNLGAALVLYLVALFISMLGSALVIGVFFTTPFVVSMYTHFVDMTIRSNNPSAYGHESYTYGENNFSKNTSNTSTNHTDYTSSTGYDTVAHNNPDANNSNINSTFVNDNHSNYHVENQDEEHSSHDNK